MRPKIFIVVLALAICSFWGCSPKKGSEEAKGAKTGAEKKVEKAGASTAAASKSGKEAAPEKASAKGADTRSSTSAGQKPQVRLSANPELAELIGSLEDPHKGAPVLRTLVARAKQGNKDWMKEALSALRRALKHPKPNARSQAAQVLVLLAQKRGKKLEKSTVAALGDALVQSPDGDVRALIAKAVGASKDSRLGTPLVRVLDDDKSGSARAAAAKALGALRVKSATVPLIRALDDRAVPVRINSINALRKIKAKQAVSRLIPMLDDENTMVRSRAHKALKDLTGKKHPADPGAWR